MGNPFGKYVCVRVRAKNCNGWSDWSDRGYVIHRGAAEDAKMKENVLYVWLFHHSLEQFYPVIQKFGVTTVEQVTQLTSSDIASKT